MALGEGVAFVDAFSYTLDLLVDLDTTEPGNHSERHTIRIPNISIRAKILKRPVEQFLDRDAVDGSILVKYIGYQHGLLKMLLNKVDLGLDYRWFHHSAGYSNNLRPYNMERKSLKQD